ncbi:3-oxo-5-alpha-steroid 4-dehydrogenase-domain-containing protein [Rhizoctonia solani]|nr:3-oxo-5-alpha-steroid 4-dehydrogenase-domain-containing protein [Rhizoctonia solani]
MVSVKIQAASSRPLAIAKNLPATLEFPGRSLEAVTIGEVKQAIAKQCPQATHNHTAPVKSSDKNAKAVRPKALTDNTSLQDAGLDASSNTLYVKDLGTQVSYRTVFIVEYIGPLLIHPVVYIYRSSSTEKMCSTVNFRREHHLVSIVTVHLTLLSSVAYALVMLHFLKREFETIFVHRFSHATMPVGNLFRNSLPSTSGLLLSLALYGPWYSQGSLTVKHASPPSIFLGWGWPSNDIASLTKWIAIWAFAELSNFHAHLTLRNLRPANNPIARGIPRGYLFEYVSCPNYTFEILAWIAFTLMTKSWASLIFIIAGTTPMIIWAIKKHKAYRREFGSQYPRNRKIIVPFLF